MGYSVEDFAGYVFTLTDRVDVIDHSLERVPVDSAGALADMWRESDEEHAAQGLLPSGWTHFDLLFQARAGR